MRARRGGIVNVSSIGARSTPAGSGYYAATKAALEGLSGSLQKELAPLGISVTVVEPGGFRTDFAGRSHPVCSRDRGRRGHRRETSQGPRHDRRQPGGRPREGRAGDHRGHRGTAAAIPAPLGSDAFERYREADDAQRVEADSWHDLSCGTEFAGEKN